MGLLAVTIIVVMLAINALFAAYELALASVSLQQIAILAEKRSTGGEAALAMKGRMEASLAVIQLGITLVGAIAAAVGGAGADEGVAPWLQGRLGVGEGVAEFFALVLVVVPLSGVMIILGELIPKSFAIKNAEWVCLKLSPPMKLFAAAVNPIVVAIEWMTKTVVGVLERNVERGRLPNEIGGLHEFLAHAKALRTTRILSPQQERVIIGAGRLSSVRVQEIVVPAHDIKLLNADDQLIEHLVRVHLDAHTRFPVTTKRGDPQGIIGYVNVKDLFFLAKTHPDNPSVREITRAMFEIPPDALIGDAFARMMSEHAHLALVRDADGVVHGMLTVEDILEEVVGDIQDEFDRLPKTLVPAGRKWIVGGGATLAQLRGVLHNPHIAPSLPDRTTLCDWIATQVPAPRTGDTYTVDSIRVMIRKMRRGRTFEVVLTS